MYAQGEGPDRGSPFVLLLMTGLDGWRREGGARERQKIAKQGFAVDAAPGARRGDWLLSRPGHRRLRVGDLGPPALGHGA